MRHLSTTLFIIVLLSTQTFAQSWKWGRGHEEFGSGQSMATANALDKLGNLYTTGWYHGNIIFQGDTLTNNLGSGAAQGYIVKVDTAGNYQWAKSSTGHAYFIDVAIDKSNNVYILGGQNQGYPTFVFGGQTYNNTDTVSVPSASYQYIIKINPSGNVVWIKDIGNVWNHGSWVEEKISIDDNNNIILSVQFSDVAVIGTNTLTSLSADSTTDILIAKYDSACNPIWAKRFGGPKSDVSNTIDVDQSGNIFIAGRYDSDTITFDSFSLVNTDSAFIKWHAYLAKLDSNGNVLWLKGTSAGIGYIVEVACNSVGDVFLAGFYNSQLPFVFESYAFPAPPYNHLYSFVMKCNSDGDVEWAKNMHGERVLPLTICTDDCDNVWLNVNMGYDNVTTNDTIDGNVVTPPVVNAWPNFIAGWDNWGNFKTIGILPTGYDQHPNGLVADRNGKLYLAAETRGIDTFYIANDPIIISNGIRQMFIAKFDPEIACFPASVKSVTSESNISIYPNPATDLITIKASNQIKNVSVRNTVGQLVFEQAVNKKTTELNISQLTPGIYFITVTDTDGNMRTAKMVKE